MTIKEIYILKENLNKLANGVDPQTGIQVEDYIPLSKFNKNILLDAERIMEIILQNGIDKLVTKTDRKIPFFLTDEEKKRIQFSETPIPISAFTYRINEICIKKVKATQITKWLTTNGYLEKYVDDDKEFKIATDKGKTIGISTINKTSQTGRTYPVNVYDISAQKFILQQLQTIMEEV